MRAISRMRIMSMSLCLIFTFASCGSSDEEYDAAGTFESTEVIVSAESMGEILQFDIVEGQQLIKNQRIGIIDTTQLLLKKQQLMINQQSMLIRRPDKQKQLAALVQQIETAKIEKKRIMNLVNANAVNQKQLDDIDALIAVLEKQLTAQKTLIENTNDGISMDNEALRIQIEQIDDQLNKSIISSPIDGIVLMKYAEIGELAAPGKALFKVADMNNMILRAYFTNDQLSRIKLGQTVKVNVESGKDDKEYKATIIWISSKSEFTPKTIATRDERANMVYAVKISVKNDGFLRIGMYGNVKF